MQNSLKYVHKDDQQPPQKKRQTTIQIIHIKFSTRMVELCRRGTDASGRTRLWMFSEMRSFVTRTCSYRVQCYDAESGYSALAPRPDDFVAALGFQQFSYSAVSGKWRVLALRRQTGGGNAVPSQFISQLTQTITRLQSGFAALYRVDHTVGVGVQNSPPQSLQLYIFRRASAVVNAATNRLLTLLGGTKLPFPYFHCTIAISSDRKEK